MAPLIPHGVQNAIKTEGDVKARPLSSKQNHAGNIASTFENLDLLLINNSRVLSNWIWIALVIFLLAVYTAAAFHYPGLSPIRIIPLVLGAVFTQGLLVSKRVAQWISMAPHSEQQLTPKRRPVGFSPRIGTLIGWQTWSQT